MNTPSLSGNWVDLFLIIFLISFVLSGVGRGFIINLIDVVSFIMSFTIALKFYPFASKLIVANFSLPLGIANALGFILIGFLIETVFFIVIRIFYQYIPASVIHSRINKLLGPIPALVNGFVIAAFFLNVIIATPIQPRIKHAVLSSKLGAPLIERTQIVERELAKIFGEAVLDTLSFITIQPESQERVNLQFNLTDVLVDKESEVKMLVLINTEREKAGLDTLNMSESIQIVARDHAADMFARGYFSHVNTEGESPFDRLKKYNIDFLAAGENLAFAPTVELAHQGLINSPGHRANILSEDFGKVGIGVIDGGAYGKMFVQNFTD